MKRILPILVSTLFIIIGITFLTIVLRMVWFPPNSMGMMMGRNMMFHHMFFMFGQSVFIAMIVLGVLIIIWMLINRKKK